MSNNLLKEFDTLFSNYPQLDDCQGDIISAFELIKECYLSNGLIMTCGNGGSASDAGHIVGELMKGFKLKRPLTAEQEKKLTGFFPEEGKYLSSHLQQAIPAITLTDQTSLSSAFANDVAQDMVFAQQVFGYGKPGDVLIGFSTSGNSPNVVNACKVAKAFGMKTIAMTGDAGGELLKICDITIRVPAHETYRIQEYHLPVYHCICAMLEDYFFYDRS